MTDITSSYRTSQKNRDTLNDLHGSISAGTEKAVDAYLSIRPLVLRQISKKFKGEDIKSMAGVLKGSSWDPTYASSTSVLVSKLSMELDAETDKTKQSKLAILIETIKTISPAECYFLQEEIFRRLEQK